MVGINNPNRVASVITSIEFILFAFRTAAQATGCLYCDILSSGGLQWGLFRLSNLLLSDCGFHYNSPLYADCSIRVYQEISCDIDYM